MILKPVKKFLEKRRFPTLLMIAAGLLGINLFIADPLPFIDELLMLIATLLIGSLKKRKPDQSDETQDESGQDSGLD